MKMMSSMPPSHCRVAWSSPSRMRNDTPTSTRAIVTVMIDANVRPKFRKRLVPVSRTT